MRAAIPSEHGVDLQPDRRPRRGGRTREPAVLPCPISRRLPALEGGPRSPMRLADVCRVVGCSDKAAAKALQTFHSRLLDDYLVRLLVLGEGAEARACWRVLLEAGP
jgi:hypothetical protein